jgi:hypothetical protein
MSEAENTKILRTDEPDDYVRLSAHPRAQRAIARSKALGGLIGFLIGLWMGSRAGLPAWDTGVRALTGGIAGYVVVWIAAVQIWRQVAIAEFRHAEQRRSEQRAVERAALAEIRRQRAEAAEAARS